MNARTEEAALTSTTGMMPIQFIAPSLTNPRKTKNEDTFKEFVANIAKVGILQPVLVRPMPATRTDKAAEGKTHELVFGHRRLAGAIAAGLQNIPVSLRELTDLEVLEIQIIENLQREDVHPLEEAEGYERLMQQTNPATKAKYTAEEIGARIGKSRRYVYNRLKLLDLCPEARKAFYQGELDSSKAYLLARIDDHKIQLDALEKVFRANPDLNVRDAADELQDRYMLTLSKAPFDIKVVSYVDSKGKPIAGACAPCPKRTGNNPDLFGDIKSADMCTDVACFKAKTAAHKAIEVKKATDAGKTVLDSKESAKVFERWNPTEPKHSSGYKRLDAVIPGQGETFKKALGKELPTVVVQNPHTNKLVEVINEPAANALLVAKGLTKKPSSSTSNNNPGSQAHLQQKAAIEREGRIDAWVEARAKFVLGLAETEWRFLAQSAIQNAVDTYVIDEESFQDLMALYQIDLNEFDTYQAGMAAVKAMVDKLPVAQIPRLLFELQHFEQIVDGMGTNEDVAWFKDLFKRCNVNVDGYIEKARKDAKEKAAAEKKEAAEKAKAEKAAKPADKKPAKKAASK